MDNIDNGPMDVKNEYRLLRGGQEYVRLTAQHYVLTERQGWLLHPTITTAIQHLPKPRIADVATGNGVWAINLAQEMPHAEIAALDISDEQFPPPFSLPQNVTLGLYDVLQDVPANLQGTFDIVHIRLLLAAGPDVDKSIFVDRFRTLLRPGGWLQWEETLCSNLHVPAHTDAFTKDIIATPLLEHPIIHISRKHLGLGRRLDWMIDFERVMTQLGGFQNLFRYVVPMRPHLLPIESTLLRTALNGIVEVFITKKLDPRPEVLEELRNAVDDLNRDMDEGLMLAYAWHVCTGQKKGEAWKL